MSSFVPLNLTEDPTLSKKDLEEEHSRELQVEQAFKIFQEALTLQKSESFYDSYKLYDELFKLEILSNHYQEEEDFVRGLQKGSQNTINDELSFLSPNIKSLRFLVFRNRGFLYLNILKNSTTDSEMLEQLISLDSKKSEKKDNKVGEKFRDLFYTLIDDFCISLFYQEGDEKLLNQLYEIFAYLEIFKLAKFTLEYSLSGTIESDDLTGLLPLNNTTNKQIKLLRGILSISDLNQKQITRVEKQRLDLNKRYAFLSSIKQEFEKQIKSSNTKRSVNIQLSSDESSLNWSNVIHCINKELKTFQDDEKLEDVQRSKLKYVEPYLLTEDPIELINFVIPDAGDEIFEDARENIENEEDIIAVEDIQNEPITIEDDVKMEDAAEIQNLANSPSVGEDNSKKPSHRLSKRLNRSETDTPEVDLRKEHFDETKYFYDSTNYYFTRLVGDSPELKVNNMIDLYFSTGTEGYTAPLYLNDFVDILNDWDQPKFSKFLAVSEDTTTGKSANDERLKLIEVLNSFGTKGISNNTDNMPLLASVENKDVVREFLLEHSRKSLHYLDIKISILKRLLGVHYRPTTELDVESTLEEENHANLGSNCCLISDSLWSKKLYSQIKEWVIQFDSFILENLKLNDPGCSFLDSLNNLAIATSIQEILIDTYISIKSQITTIIAQVAKKVAQKSSKSSINNLSLELMKIRDKLSKWTSFYEETLYRLDLTEGSEETDELLFKIKSRFKWSQIYKEKSQNSNWADNDLIMAKVNELLEYVDNSNFKSISISLPNYEHITEMNLEVIKSQLTTTSVMSMFSKIIYSDSTENNTEAIRLLEGILISEDERKSNAEELSAFEKEALMSIKIFLDNSPIDMKLSLWNVLFIYYVGSGKIESFQYGFEKVLVFIQDYFLSTEYKDLSPTIRSETFLSVLGFYGDILNSYLESIGTLGWKLPSAEDVQVKTTLEILLRFIEMFYLFGVHEEAALISNSKISIKGKSGSACESLRNIFVSTVCAVIVYSKEASKNRTRTQAEQEEANSILLTLISHTHHQLGIRSMCGCSSGRFLKLIQELIGGIEGVEIDKELSQIISCRYHYKIAIDNFVPTDHNTENKEQLDLESTTKLAGFVLPLCFKKNPLVRIPKHDTKSLIDDFYEVVGDPTLDQSEILSRNDSAFEYFFEVTRITPRLLKDAFHGLLRLDLGELDTSPNVDIIKNGLYYLQGLLIFSSYKVRKKNMQSRAVELEQIIMLLKNDLIHCTNRIESWYLLGQAYGFLVEDDLIWTSDKLTVADRKVGTANLQRKSLLCYLMAINGTLNMQGEKEKLLVKPIIGDLMTSFSKEMYSASMEPMSMHAFKVQSQPRFVRKTSGAAFVNVSTSSISQNLCLKLIQQSLHLAIKSKLTDWSIYYYLAKVQRKLGKSPQLVLSTLEEAGVLAREQSANQDHIIEPHYMMISMIYKYYKKGEISYWDAMKFIYRDPVFDAEVLEKEEVTDHDFLQILISCLKKVDNYDKKNWHHKPKFRLASILFLEFGKTDEALEEMSSFISLKATSKTLVSIWKPENERPGKHFYYTYQYSKFFILLLTKKLDLIGLISMLPKLRRSNSTMVDLYAAWEILCSSVCKIIRSSLSIGNSFSFFETFMQSLSYQTFMLNSKAILEVLQQNGIPKDLEAHFCLLHAINDMKKFNNGFGPTSLIDDTIVGIFLKIYLYFDKDFEHPLAPPVGDSPGGKVKKIAKRDIFPFATDLLKSFKKEIDAILEQKPELYNTYVIEAKAEQEELAKKLEIEQAEAAIRAEEEIRRREEEEAERRAQEEAYARSQPVLYPMHKFSPRSYPNIPMSFHIPSHLTYNPPTSSTASTTNYHPLTAPSFISKIAPPFVIQQALEKAEMRPENRDILNPETEKESSKDSGDDNDLSALIQQHHLIEQSLKSRPFLPNETKVQTSQCVKVEEVSVAESKSPSPEQNVSIDVDPVSTKSSRRPSSKRSPVPARNRAPSIPVDTGDSSNVGDSAEVRNDLEIENKNSSEDTIISEAATSNIPPEQKEEIVTPIVEGTSSTTNENLEANKALIIEEPASDLPDTERTNEVSKESLGSKNDKEESTATTRNTGGAMKESLKTFEIEDKISEAIPVSTNDHDDEIVADKENSIDEEKPAETNETNETTEQAQKKTPEKGVTKDSDDKSETNGSELLSEKPNGNEPESQAKSETEEKKPVVEKETRKRPKRVYDLPRKRLRSSANIEPEVTSKD